MRVLRECLALVVMPLALTVAAYAEVPLSLATPEGFVWKQLEPIKAALLMPHGWHYREEAQKGTLAFFITEENIDRNGRFETGLTLNVIRSLKTTKAQDYAKAFIAKLGSQNELLTSWETGAGVLKGFGCRARMVPKDGSPAVILQALALGNARTNTLYLFIFESPESKWDSAWAKGSRIMDKLFLDDEI